MVGIGIASASPGADAASIAKTGRGAKSSSDDTNGFLDALSNSGNGRDARAPAKDAAADAKSADADGAASDGSDASDTAAQQPAAADATAAAKDAQIAAALKAKGAVQSFAQSLNAMPQPTQTAAVPVPADVAMPATDATATDAPAATIAQQLAAMVAGEAAGQPVTDAKDGISAAKGGKTATATAGDADDAATDDSSDANATTGAVSDALSLLNSALPSAIVPAQTAASVLAAAGQLHSGAKVVASADGSTATPPADAVVDKADAVAAGMAMLAAATPGNAGDDATPATGDDSTSMTVRVARADSKAQAVDLAVSKKADDAAQLDIKIAASNGSDTVTVLDSRRFLGLADGSNSALVANSLTGNKDWAAAMQPNAALTGASVVTSPSKVVNMLKIQMNPENLGLVTATMRLSGEQLTVDLKVQSAEAYRQLSNDQSSMVDSLRQQGYSVDRITVTYAAADTSSNSQSGSQAQQQQSGASQGQGGETQDRKQNSGRQANDQNGVWGTGNVVADDSVAGSAQRARAGGVYL